MHRYNRTSLAVAADYEDNGFEKIEEYLSAEDDYWLNNDVWEVKSGKFEERGIDIEGRKRGSIADFSMILSYTMKTELKYYVLWSLTNKMIRPTVFSARYMNAMKELSVICNEKKAAGSITDIKLTDEFSAGIKSKEASRLAGFILNRTVWLLENVYSCERETSRDVWRPKRVPGARLSATQMRSAGVLNFEEIPAYYRESIKRYMNRLVVKRSWSYCTEMLRYIKRFFRLFYENGYGDGFLKGLSRQDVEKYLAWAAAEYEGDNATYASKAVSFIRQFLDYIQMAEYPQAPVKDIYRLIYDEDIPKRERLADTFEKVKYIPEPVLIQLDANISEIEPEEMQPLYVILRETGWRGTDALNLRYDTCLDYEWNKAEGRYVPFLCGEITKTGIPLLKVPIRDEVAELVKELVKEAESKSTEDNNPHRYLFNTYEGLNQGLPYRKPAFSAAVQDMIERKDIRDADGEIYHFRAHSLRHTRASEYAEQGMPIGVIRKLLGHCSLQMTLHYAQYSEDIVYRKWKESTELGSLHLNITAPGSDTTNIPDGIHYEKVNLGLDAVRVPFGVCFKPSKLACRTQMKHCLECANFCSSRENESEYREEIRRVGEQIALAKRLDRDDWIEKNTEYLKLLLAMLERIKAEGVVHKNGALREGSDA